MPQRTPTYTLRPAAYLKALLHSAKFPHATVIGLLLGSSDGIDVDLEDAVPLLHRWSDLSPMLEAGLAMADAYARDRGLRLVGVYSAPSRLDDTRLSTTVQKVAEAVRRSGCDEAVALVLNNQTVGTHEAAFLPYTPPAGPSGSAWTPHPAGFTSSGPFTLSDPSIPSNALAAVRARAFRDLGDFDDHLEDIGVDWLANPGVTVKR